MPAQKLFLFSGAHRRQYAALPIVAELREGFRRWSAASIGRLAIPAFAGAVFERKEDRGGRS